LCSEYMQGFGATWWCIWVVDEKEGVAREVLEGMPRPRTLIEGLCDIAHVYVCDNHKALSNLRK
jgi:hypothetical protein